MLRALALATALAAPLAVALGLAGCAINTDPILADGDAGAGTIDLGPPDIVPAYEAPPAYAGCDVDWSCTADCDDDLDCPQREGIAPPAYDDQADVFAGPETVELGPGEELWHRLGAVEADDRVTAGLEAGAVTLAVYDAADGRLLARSVEEPVVELTDAAPDAALRLVAGPDGARLTLERTPADAPE